MIDEEIFQQAQLNFIRSLGKLLKCIHIINFHMMVYKYI